MKKQIKNQQFLMKMRILTNFLTTTYTKYNNANNFKYNTNNKIINKISNKISNNISYNSTSFNNSKYYCNNNNNF